MRPSPAARRLLGRLEATTAEALRGAPEAALAFSAGLGSTLVAAIARKRCDLRCLVVGGHDAPDVRAAKVAAAFLDYAVTIVPVDVRKATALAEDVTRRLPKVGTSQARGLVPALAARDHAGTDRILVGFGAARLPPPVRPALGKLGLVAPLLAASRTPPVRSRLAECARILGLPPAFARPTRRPPLVGSGLAPAFTI